MQRQRTTGRGSEYSLAIRPAPSPLKRVLDAADDARELTGIAHKAQRYIRATYAPDNREPGCIVNRRDELSRAVRNRDARIAKANPAANVRWGLRRSA